MLPMRLVLRVGRVAGLLLERPPNKSTSKDTDPLGRRGDGERTWPKHQGWYAGGETAFEI